MNLNELFPEQSEVEINGKKYAVQYKTPALFYLERQFKGRKVTVGDREETVKLRDAFHIMGFFLDQMRTGEITLEDSYHLMYAGVFKSGDFKDFDDFSEKASPHNVANGMLDVVKAMSNAYLTPEQIEKLNTMTERAGKNADEPAQTE